MAFDLFLLEVVISGLMTGVMYALVALGFVLIFKASGVFNFAQGVLALFAALALYDFLAEDGWFFAVFGFTLPVWLAIPATALIMILQLPIPVNNSSRAPIMIAITDVSPTDPGIIPIKASSALY